jgi:hypothetical protein
VEEMMRSFSPVLAGAAVLLMAGWTAEAKSKYVADVAAAYPASNASCATCHANPKPTKAERALNPYGADVKQKALVRDEAGKKVLDLAKVDGLDSDGDGKSNGEELKAGTNPGDPASK